MAQFRTTADLVDNVLSKSGETTNGNSAYEALALQSLNKIHHVLMGGGNEFNVECNETWPWAKARRPIVMELKPFYNTGSITVTLGSEAGTFTSAPTDSLAGWHIRANGKDGVYKIAKHVAGETAFELDGAYDNDSGTLAFKAFKLDYTIAPSYIVIDSTNNKLDFEETASSELTATITVGSYTPADLATEIDTQLTAAGASAYTITYSATTQKFTMTSDLAGGGGTFKLLAASGTNASESIFPTLGFDIEDQATAATHTGIYPIGGIARLVEPIRVYRRSSKHGKIVGIDANRFMQDYPLYYDTIQQGIPTRFTKLHEDEDGIITIRFNRYPANATRIELDHVPMPVDLKDNAVSRPWVPRKLIDILEYGAAAYVLFEKEDTQAQTYFELAKQKLEAAIRANRAEQAKIGPDFGRTIARDDLLDQPRRLRYGYTSDDF